MLLFHFLNENEYNFNDSEYQMMLTRAAIVSLVNGSAEKNNKQFTYLADQHQRNIFTHMMEHQ